MRFDGAVNLLGLLDNLTVSPSEVRVRAGGTVTFVNDSAVSLNLAVAGRTSTLPSGGSRRYDFPGGATAQSFHASVTPLKVAVVGDALRSSGRVRVAAAPQSAAEDAASPRPSPASTPDSLPRAAPSDTTTGSAPESPTHPSPTSEASREADTPTPVHGRDFGNAPTLDGLLEPDVPRRGAQPGADDSTAPEGVLSTFTDDRQVGLLIVVAAVLLIGVTSAAMRVVVARRKTVLRG